MATAHFSGSIERALPRALGVPTTGGAGELPELEASGDALFWRVMVAFVVAVTGTTIGASLTFVPCHADPTMPVVLSAIWTVYSMLLVTVPASRIPLIPLAAMAVIVAQVPILLPLERLLSLALMSGCAKYHWDAPARQGRDIPAGQ